MSLSEEIKAVLVDNGVDIDGGSFHSWRCFDKGRYPEPCNCTDTVVQEIMAVVIKAAREAVEAIEAVGLAQEQFKAVAIDALEKP